MGANLGRHFDLRRHNYGERANGVVKVILVALDLLIPDNELAKKESCSISSEFSIAEEATITVTVRPDKRFSKQKLAFNTYRISGETVNALFQHELIKKSGGMTGRANAKPTALAELALTELLDAHDRMHIGHTLHLKTGIYRHFKGDDRIYNVLGVSADTEDGTLRVIYQPLYGEHYAKLCNRPLAMFAQVIGRDSYLGPRFALFIEQKTQLLTRHGE